MENDYDYSWVFGFFKGVLKRNQAMCLKNIMSAL